MKCQTNNGHTGYSLSPTPRGKLPSSGLVTMLQWRTLGDNVRKVRRGTSIGRSTLPSLERVACPTLNPFLETPLIVNQHEAPQQGNVTQNST